jgi:hypothetical protein
MASNQMAQDCLHRQSERTIFEEVQLRPRTATARTIIRYEFYLQCASGRNATRPNPKIERSHAVQDHLRPLVIVIPLEFFRDRQWVGRRLT